MRLWLVGVNRLDQTLGKPSVWMVSNEREKQRMTVISRLSRVELQVSCSFCSQLLTVHCYHLILYHLCQHL